MGDKYEVAYALSIGTEIIDLEWPWTAKMHSVAEKMRLLEPLPRSRKMSWSRPINASVLVSILGKVKRSRSHLGLEAKRLGLVSDVIVSFTSLDVGTVKCTELDVEQSSAHPVQPDIAVSALDRVDATHLVTYTTRNTSSCNLLNEYQITCLHGLSHQLIQATFCNIRCFPYFPLCQNASWE